MQIDDILITAIQAAIKEAGNQSEFSRKCGVSQQCLSNYLKGKTKVVDYDNWERLYPHIKPFLPPDRARDARGTYGASAENHREEVPSDSNYDGPHVSRTSAEIRATLLQSNRAHVDSIEQAILSHPLLSRDRKNEMLSELLIASQTQRLFVLQEELLKKEEECRKLLTANLQQVDNMQNTIKKIISSKLDDPAKIDLLREILQLNIKDQS